MQIRYATPDDLPDIQRMGMEFHGESCYAQTVPCDIASFTKTLVSIISEGNGAVFVAETDDKKIIGMAGALIQPHWFNHKHIAGQELFWWVDHEARGSSAGVRLMKTLEIWAAEKGCNTFSMASTANLNPEKLSNFYKRSGYVPQDIYYVKAIPSCQAH